VHPKYDWTRFDKELLHRRINPKQARVRHIEASYSGNDPQILAPGLSSSGASISESSQASLVLERERAELFRKRRRERYIAGCYGRSNRGLNAKGKTPGTSMSAPMSNSSMTSSWCQTITLFRMPLVVLILTITVYMASPEWDMVDPSASIFGPHPPGTESDDPTPTAVFSARSKSALGANFKESQLPGSTDDSNAIEVRDCKPSVSSAKTTDTSGTSTLRKVENADTDEPSDDVDSRKMSQASHAEKYEGLGKYTMVYRTREHKETETKENFDDQNAVTKFFHAMGCCVSSSKA